MEYEFTMPKLGENMEEGTVLRWRKREGEAFEKGDILLEVEADKASLEVDAMAGGRLRKILVQEGEIVPVGTPVAILED